MANTVMRNHIIWIVSFWFLHHASGEVVCFKQNAFGCAVEYNQTRFDFCCNHFNERYFNDNLDIMNRDTLHALLTTLSGWSIAYVVITVAFVCCLSFMIVYYGAFDCNCLSFFVLFCGAGAMICLSQIRDIIDENDLVEITTDIINNGCYYDFDTFSMDQIDELSNTIYSIGWMFLLCLCLAAAEAFTDRSPTCITFLGCVKWGIFVADIVLFVFIFSFLDQWTDTLSNPCYLVENTLSPTTPIPTLLSMQPTLEPTPEPTHDPLIQLNPRSSVVAWTECSHDDKLFCAYSDGLDKIFGTSDSLQSAQDQSEFDTILTSITGSNTVMVYNAANNTLLTSPGTGSPFGDRDKVVQLVASYGNEICEDIDVSVNAAPERRLSTTVCRGWIYVSGAGHTITKEIAPLSIDDLAGIYAILMGRMLNFNGEFIYYFYVHPLEYRRGTWGCLSDTQECSKTNTQMLLGNALFYISVLRYDYSDNAIWDTMNDNMYFMNDNYSTVIDVFVNEYSDGYRYVHPDPDKRNTPTTKHSELRVGADELFGEWIELETTNRKKKRLFVIGPYPNVQYGGRTRLYVGAGYVYGSGTGDAKKDPHIWRYISIVVVVLIVCGLCAVACAKNDGWSLILNRD
eukprot:56485_1